MRYFESCMQYFSVEDVLDQQEKKETLMKFVF